MVAIVAIWIKRAHRGPMDAVAEAELIAGRGVRNKADQGGGRQVTVIEESAWREAMEDLGAQVDPSARRANLMIWGIDLQDSRGKKLVIGESAINIRGQNPPC